MTWKYIWGVQHHAPDVTDGLVNGEIKGIKGQNTENPRADFINHIVVTVGTNDKYYDPSYGQIHYSKLAFQQNFVAAFGKKDTIQFRTSVVFRKPGSGLEIAIDPTKSGLYRGE